MAGAVVEVAIASEFVNRCRRWVNSMREGIFASMVVCQAHVLNVGRQHRCLANMIHQQQAVLAQCEGEELIAAQA